MHARRPVLHKDPIINKGQEMRYFCDNPECLAHIATTAHELRFYNESRNRTRIYNYKTLEVLCNVCVDEKYPDPNKCSMCGRKKQ